MTPFIENKFTRIYFAIIRNAKTRDVPPVYVEKHHIIPNSMGGLKRENNLVRLTAKEHFICHRLLTKMTAGKHQVSMIYAVYCMANKDREKRQLKITSRTYAVLRAAFVERQKICQRLTGRNWYNNGLKDFKLFPDDPRTATFQKGKRPYIRTKQNTHRWFHNDFGEQKLLPEEGAALGMSPGRSKERVQKLKTATTDRIWYYDSLDKNYFLLPSDPRSNEMTRGKIDTANVGTFWFNDGAQNYRLTKDSPLIAKLSLGMGFLSNQKRTNGRKWFNDGSDNYMLYPNDETILRLNLHKGLLKK